MVIRKKAITVTLGKADSSTSGKQPGSPAVTKVRIRTRDRIRIITAVPDDNSGNYFRFSNSQKSFEQKKYLKIFIQPNYRYKVCP